MAKICSYNHAKEIQHYLQRPHLNGDSEDCGYDYQMLIEFIAAECLQANCGAWHDGKCNYAAAGLARS